MIKDLLDDNYIFSSKKINTLNENIYAGKDYTYLKGFVRYLYKIIDSIKYLNIFSFFKSNQNGLALVGTLNTYNTIKTLHRGLSFNIVSFYFNSKKDVIPFPLFYVYFLSLLFFPFTIIIFLLSNSYVRKSFKYSLNEYSIILSYRLIFCIYLLTTRTKYLIISNDHILYFRSAVKVANFLKIPTYYIQHASVTSKFPDLVTKFAFLDGEDSKRKYTHERKKPKTEIFLTGSTRYDVLNTIKKDVKGINKIGIATNEYDSLNLVRELINYLKNDYQIFLRPHPQDKRYKDWEDLANKLNVFFSDSKKVDYYTYIDNLDSVIACNSNIILEAIISGRPSYSFQFSDDVVDHYGFIRNNLTKHFKTKESLKKELKNISHNTQQFETNCKFFYELYKSNGRENSTDLIIKLIKETSSKL